MKGKISLKKEIANIIDNAEHLGDRKVKCNRYNMVQTNMCVAEVVNEHGYKCTYYFKENCKDLLLQRAAAIQRGTSYKFKTRDNGNSTQQILLFLKENSDALQVLHDINYLMKTNNYNAQQACRILFKDKKQLPPNFCQVRTNDSCNPIIYRFYMNSYSQRINIEYLMENILPILPKSYWKGIGDF